MAALLLATASGCAPASPAAGGDAAHSPGGPFPAGEAHHGPVVLITLASLRADRVGALAGGELTPNLDALAAEADWVGRAVAPSSWSLPSLTTLATGLPPWLHQVITPRRSHLGREVTTLAEAFDDRGYTASAYVSGSWFHGSSGWGQGFNRVRALRGGAFAAGHLQSLGQAGTGSKPGSQPAPQLLWIQIPEPAAPYERLDRPRGRPPSPPGGATDRLPRSLGAADLERWSGDPAEPVPAARRHILERLYDGNVVRADGRLGRMLDALRASGVWDDTLLVVTSPNGEELGEYGSAGSGNSLGRALLEVPLVIKLPRALRAAAGAAPVIAEPPGRRVALARVWSTLVEAVGGTVPPAAAPSLFRHDDGGILSELYMLNGTNELSLVAEADGTDGSGGSGRGGGTAGPAGAAAPVVAWQLVWRSRFADPDPEYRPARLARFLDAPPPGLTESPRAVFDRLNRAFAAEPPLSGRAGEAPVLTLLRWPPGGGVEEVRDAARTRVMAARLRRRWLAFQECERSPGAEASQRRAARGAPHAGPRGTPKATPNATPEPRAGGRGGR